MYRSLKAMCKSRIGVLLGKFPMVRRTLFCRQYANAGGMIAYLFINRATGTGGHFVAIDLQLNTEAAVLVS
jgi:hypothetical protein